MASHRDSESGDDDNAEFEQALAEALLNEIYRSTFMLEMIETAHVNATTGFLEAIIATCAIALEHAFSYAAIPKVHMDDQGSTKGSTTSSKACKTPPGIPPLPAFSETNCRLATAEYYESIVKCGMQYTADIIDLVHQRQDAAQKVKRAPVEVKSKGGRALLSYCYLLITIQKTWQVSNLVRRRALITNIHAIMINIMTPLAEFMVDEPFENGKAAPTFQFYPTTAGEDPDKVDDAARELQAAIKQRLDEAIGLTPNLIKKERLNAIKFSVDGVFWPIPTIVPKLSES
ncbi:hypothetical protein DFH29DRAFT_1004963 [Suillus ampliporus]|nr:hypothetical protein DFH29DRAFT_1004963 [Suillus ampliporus]